LTNYKIFTTFPIYFFKEALSTFENKKIQSKEKQAFINFILLFFSILCQFVAEMKPKKK
jgi:hypothetical protein